MQPRGHLRTHLPRSPQNRTRRDNHRDLPSRASQRPADRGRLQRWPQPQHRITGRQHAETQERIRQSHTQMQWSETGILPASRTDDSAPHHGEHSLQSAYQASKTLMNPSRWQPASSKTHNHRGDSQTLCRCRRPSEHSTHPNALQTRGDPRFQAGIKIPTCRVKVC